MKRLSDDLLALSSLDQESPVFDEDDCHNSNQWSTGPHDVPVLLPEEFEALQEEDKAVDSSNSILRGMASSVVAKPLQTIANCPSVSTIDTIGTRVFGTPLTNSPVQTYVRDSSFSVASLGADENGGIVQSSSTKTITGMTVGIGLGVLNCDAYSEPPRSTLDDDTKHQSHSGGETNSPGARDARAFSPNIRQLPVDTSDDAADTSSDSNRAISLVTEWAPASHWQSASSIASPVTPTPATPRALRSPAIRERGANHVRNFSRPISHFSPGQEGKIASSVTASELALQSNASPIKTKRRPLSEMVSRSPLLCKAGKSPRLATSNIIKPPIVLPCLKEASWLRDCDVQLWIDQEGFRAICPCFKLSRVTYAPLDQLSDLPESCRAAAFGFGQINTEMTLLATVAEFVPSKRETYYFHHAAMDRAPCLRRITVGKDEGKDYVHRQASLNVKTHGVYSVTGSEEYRIYGDGGHADRVVSLHWRFEYFVNERWNDRTGKLMQGERTFKPLVFSCTSMLLRGSRATKVKLFSVVKKKIISSKLTADKVEPPMPPPNWCQDHIVESPMEDCQHRGKDTHEKEFVETSPMRSTKHARTYSQQESGCRLSDIGAETGNKGHGRARSASYSREKRFGTAPTGLEVSSSRTPAAVGENGPVGPIIPRDELLRMFAEDLDPKANDAVQSPLVQERQARLELRVDDENDDIPLLALSPPPATVYARAKPIPTCI